MNFPAAIVDVAVCVWRAFAGAEDELATFGFLPLTEELPGKPARGHIDLALRNRRSWCNQACRLRISRESRSTVAESRRTSTTNHQLTVRRPVKKRTV
jgi:hypothetical protein